MCNDHGLNWTEEPARDWKRNSGPLEKYFQEGFRGTADPSTTLRSGRDDKGEGGASNESWLVDDRTADPSASNGMTKGRVVLLLGVG